MMGKTLRILLVAVVMLGIWSCSSSRRAGGKKSEPTGDVAALLPVLADKGNWQTMKIPVNVNLREPVSARINGTMTLVRGKEIRMSFRFFGMEVAAASVTDDSIKAYVKVKKIYLSESLSSLLGGFPVTVDNIQSLLLGRLFQPGSSSPEYKICVISGETSSEFIVEPPEPLRGLECLFTAQTDPALIRSLSVSYPGGYNAAASYSYARDFRGAFPDDLSLTGRRGGMTFDFRLGYSTGSIDRSASSPAPFSIPSGYSRVPLSSLVRLLDNL